MGIGELPPAELEAWLQARKAALEKKMAREQGYLARRRARGTHTPTDEAYEADQVLEGDLLALLEELLAYVLVLREEHPA